MASTTRFRAAPLPRRFVAGVGLAVAAMLGAVGCQSTVDGLPILTDPAEIVMAGVRSTAALQYVHVRVDGNLQVAPAGQGNGAMFQQIALDFDMDVARRAIAGRTVAKAAGQPDRISEVLLVNGEQFVRGGPDTRWTHFPNTNGPMQLPSTDDIINGISPLIGREIVVHPADSEACGAGTCYHVVADLDPLSSMWIVGPIFLGSVPTGPPDPGMGVQSIRLDLYVDQATRLLVGANGLVTFKGASVAMRLTLTNHDIPLNIAPPLPGLVDEMDSMLRGVGEPIAAPTP